MTPTSPSPSSRSFTPPPPPIGRFAVRRGIQECPQRVALYGPGGIGKTTLASALQDIGRQPLVIDLDAGSNHLDIARVPGISDWEDLSAVVTDTALWKNFDIVVIDSLTRAQDLCATSIMRTERVQSLESAGGGYGKGYRMLYERMLGFLALLDLHVTSGRDVVLILHEFVARVPNPMGEDFIRYEPNLYAGDKASVRHRVKEWVDHLLFLGYDVFSAEGKAKGNGSRTIYPQELPAHWAKSRKLSVPIPFRSPNDTTLWETLFHERNHSDERK